MKAKRIYLEIIVFLFILLFLYAAGSKLTEYNKFIGQMGKSPILTNFAPTLAWAVPTVEILICLMLMIPRWRLMGLYSAFTLMVVFTLYIAGILSFSKELPCACGGVLSSLGWAKHLVFNIVFVILGGTGIILQMKVSKTENNSESFSNEPQHI
jgi:uncharacterized membrane protein YphA (DoxX/SURF4 family)